MTLFEFYWYGRHVVSTGWFYNSFSKETIQLLKKVLNGGVISRPARSCDVTALDFYLRVTYNSGLREQYRINFWGKECHIWCYWWKLQLKCYCGVERGGGLSAIVSRGSMPKIDN